MSSSSHRCPPRGGTRRRRSPTRRVAFTLPEMLVVLVIAGILLGLAAVRLTEATDEAAVRAAAGDIAAALSTARGVAIYRRAAVAVAIDTLAAALFVREDTS